MKKILKMIEKFEAEGETLKASEDKIVKAISKLLAKNSYVKEKMKQIDCCDDKCYIMSNDMDGVDYTLDFKLSETGLNFPDEFLKLAFEDYLDGTGIHYNSKEGQLVNSTSDEIFVLTHSKQIILPNEERETYVDDFHAWLIIENYIETSGYYPGIYSSDYNSNVDNFKFDQDYKELFPDDETPQKRDKLKNFLELYEIKDAIENRGNGYTLGSLPDDMMSGLSQNLRDLDQDGKVTVYSIESITAEKLVMRLELSDNIFIADHSSKLIDAKYNVFEIELSLMPNSLRFILSTDKPSGGIYEMSLLPI